MALTLRPNFLGIGLPHCGTSWLHMVLATHPDVCIPRAKKEINYFNFNYHRGEDWYLSHFRSADRDGQKRAIGEVSPMYVFGDLVSRRIREFGSVGKFIVLCRDPKSRLLSSFGKRSRSSDRSYDRSAFLHFHGIEFEVLFAGRVISEFVSAFPHRNFLFLMPRDLEFGGRSALDKLAEFLEIERVGFNELTGMSRFNESQAPRARWLYRTGSLLRDKFAPDFEWSTQVEIRFPRAKNLLFGAPRETPNWLFDELRLRKDDINADTLRLSALLDEDLTSWLIE